MEQASAQYMTREQVRAFDQHAINQWKIPGVVLMENAGLACAQTAMSMLPNERRGQVTIFCGTGNNGGDGYVIARHLLNHGHRVHVFLKGDMGKVAGDALIHLTILNQLKVPVQSLSPDLMANLAGLPPTDLVIDALLGTGLTGQLRGSYRALIEAINSLGKPVLAVDIPSGLDCDTGTPLGTAIRADQTVSFVAMKAGFQNPDSAQYTGQVTVASIGIVPQ